MMRVVCLRFVCNLQLWSVRRVDFEVFQHGPDCQRTFFNVRLDVQIR